MTMSFESPVSRLPLTSADLELLAKCGIGREQAECQIFRVDSHSGSRIMGKGGSGEFGGLVFANIWPGESSPFGYILRRDFPDLEYSSEGKVKEKAKYISEPGRSNRLFIPVGVRPEWLLDVRIPIVWVEGPKKAIALWAQAWDGLQAIPRFIVIALTGVWNWKGSIGKATDANGKRRDVKGTIPDLDRIMIGDGRKNTACFDANAATNESVALALQMFLKELEKRGAQAFVAELPQIDGINGIDDLLGIWEPSRVLDLLERAEPANVEEFGVIRSLSIAIQKTERFAQDEGGLLYRYAKGVYKPDGAAFIAKRVKALLEERKEDAKWSSHRAAEVTEYIRIDAPRLWDRPPLDKINLENGLLELSCLNLIPHSPEYLSSVQLPVRYDPAAKCKAWDRFIAETLPADAQSVVFEIVAWIAVPDTSIQKAVLATGEGANGKSVLLAGLVAFVGKHNVTALPLHKLESDRFSAARLVGKLANICADLPSEHLTSTSIFKALTGGDTMLAERKYEESFEFTPFARLIFSANHPPQSSDASQAFFRRWLVIPFERTFEGADAIPRSELDARLANPVELSGVLNKALAVLPGLRAHGFSEPDSMRRARDDFREVTDPFSVWLDQVTVEHSFAEVPKESLREAYNTFARKTGKPPMNRQVFGRAIKRLRPKLGEAQRGSERYWVYVGIGLATTESDYAQVH